MFQFHLYVKKNKKAIDRKHALHSMLRKGNMKVQITTAAKNSTIQKREHKRKVVLKFIKTGLWKTIFMIWQNLLKT